MFNHFFSNHALFNNITGKFKDSVRINLDHEALQVDMGLNNFIVIEQILFTEEERDMNMRWLKFVPRVKHKDTGKAWSWVIPFSKPKNMFEKQINHYCLWMCMAFTGQDFPDTVYDREGNIVHPTAEESGSELDDLDLLEQYMGRLEDLPYEVITLKEKMARGLVDQ